MSGVRKVVLVEAFYGGSHQQLTDTLLQELNSQPQFEAELITMSAKKWHWRARTGSLYLSQQIPHNNIDVMFTTAVFNLAELVGIRPDLVNTKKILYFHENQLVYPVRDEKERDFQYGYNQILSCLAADVVVFNSNYCLESFLGRIATFLKTIPDHRPKNVADMIRPKSRVLHYPLTLTLPLPSSTHNNNTLNIIWPHRWEHDKNPEAFFRVIMRLHEEELNFTLSVIGEHYQEIPQIFSDMKEVLSERILDWGSVPKERYWEILRSSHVVVSTADHETFGVAVLEAVSSGCYPLCPNRLVYPEFFPAECLWNTETQLYQRLKNFSRRPASAQERRKDLKLDLEKLSWENLKNDYLLLLDS